MSFGAFSEMAEVDAAVMDSKREDSESGSPSMCLPARPMSAWARLDLDLAERVWIRVRVLSG